MLGQIVEVVFAINSWQQVPTAKRHFTFVAPEESFKAKDVAKYVCQSIHDITSTTVLGEFLDLGGRENHVDFIQNVEQVHASELSV